MLTLLYWYTTNAPVEVDILSTVSSCLIENGFGTYQKKPAAKVIRATMPIAIPAIAPVDRPGECDRCPLSPADSLASEPPAYEIVELKPSKGW
jgi:hypothetical protein